MPKNFVFYDKNNKRWKKIGKISKDLISLGVLILFFIFFCVTYKPSFSESLEKRYSASIKDIIDDISTQNESSIDVSGYGPFVELKKENDSYTLFRNPLSSQKEVLLTFDDGPDPTYTPQVLDILKKENVKATFFVVGEQLIRHPDIVKRIVAEGHDIGVHTFDHTPETVDMYPSINKINYEFDFTQKIIQVQTGVTTQLFRVPNWGAEDTISMNSLIYTIGALDRGYKVVSSTKDSLDWYEKDVSKVINYSVDTTASQVILMHDGGGNRERTVSALPGIIKEYRDQGYTFARVSELSPTQPLITPASNFERLDAYVTYGMYWLDKNFYRVLKLVFGFSLVVVGISVGITLTLAITESQTKAKRKKSGEIIFFPVSVLVPAYNEENTIVSTVESLLESEYPDLGVIVIDNNSKDKTVSRLRKFKNDPRFRVVKEKIQGKFAALNKGVKEAKGEILVIIDADTQVKPDTVLNLVEPFSDAKVGAAAGYLSVGNIINPLTCFQTIEYIVGLNLDRRAYSLFSAIPIVPGALGAWRKKAVVKAGGYTPDTLTEDADLAIRIQKLGYKSVFAHRAYGFTEAPENVKAFIKQRKRWTFGIFQVLYKYRGMYFKEKYGLLGLLILPYMALVQLPFMLLSPVVDIISLASMVYFSNYVVYYFLMFLLLNTFLTVLAFIIAQEKRVWLLIFLPFMRIIYQIYWYYILYITVVSILKGEYVSWNKLHHSGSVKLNYGLEADLAPVEVKAYKKEK